MDTSSTAFFIPSCYDADLTLPERRMAAQLTSGQTPNWPEIGKIIHEEVGVPWSVMKKRIQHRHYMRRYRQRAEYYRSDRAYNVMEYLVHCLRRGREPADCILRLVGASSLQDLKQRLEHATEGRLDLTTYGVTWFFAHIRPIRTFNFSDPEQFRECVSISNLVRREIAKPWRKPRVKTEDGTPFLPGMGFQRFE